MRASHGLGLAGLALLIFIHGVLRPRVMPVRETHEAQVLRRPHVLSTLPHPQAASSHSAIVTAPAAMSMDNEQSATAGSARIRPKRYLLYASHSGFGNQELSLRRALLLAYVLNRTLVLPPLLQQSDLSFGPPEVRCSNPNWQRRMQDNAETIYRRKMSGGADDTYEALESIYDFGALQGLGMRVVDFATFRHAGGGSSSDVAPVGCAKEDRYTGRRLQKLLAKLYDDAELRMGSVYFLKAELRGLRSADSCFDAVARSVLSLPMTVPVARLQRRRPGALVRRTRRRTSGSPTVASRWHQLRALATTVSGAVRRTRTRTTSRRRWLGSRSGCQCAHRRPAAGTRPCTSPQTSQGELAHRCSRGSAAPPRATAPTLPASV